MLPAGVLLGSGSFGRVYRAKWKDCGVAVKVRTCCMLQVLLGSVWLLMLAWVDACELERVSGSAAGTGMCMEACMLSCRACYAAPIRSSHTHL